MGKIRVKTFGDEALEQEEQKKRKVEREQKILRQAQDEDVAQNASEGIESEQKPATAEATAKKPMVKKSVVARKRSKSYSEKAALVDKKNKYKVGEALELLSKMKEFSAKGGPASGWDETVELHVNTIRTGQFGSVMLPHGTGKKVRVAIADDALIEEIEKGKIDFDILLASPDMMPKLARVARVLGPKGLMPNPKNGTIAKDPKEVAKQFEAGQLTIKTEGKFPILHITVGKVSFGKEKLGDNITAVLNTMKTSNITNATIKSTMSPGVKIQTA